MSSAQPAPAAAHRRRAPVVGALVVASAALFGALGHPSWAATPSPATPTAELLAHRRPDTLHRGTQGPGVADGVVPAGVTVFDSDVPAVANLDPTLLGALRRAARKAGDNGIELYVNSGWRSAAYQEELLDEAIAKYGSREEAARWVATPATSAHVSGDAVDIGHADAARWLAEHGADYDLCQIYANEPWHYELRPGARDHGCPRLYADPAHDPRTRQ